MNDGLKLDFELVFSSSTAIVSPMQGGKEMAFGH